MARQVRKINNATIKPIPLQGGNDTRPVRGADLFPEPFANIFLSAKKRSGKTSVIWNILKRCMSSRTKLIIFCATIHKDKNWKHIIKHYKKKGVELEAYTSLRDNGVDRLAELVEDLENEIEPDEEVEEEIPPKEQIKMMGGATMNAIMAHNLVPMKGEGKPSKPRKSKYIDCEYIIVFDDLSTELKSKSLVGLLKKNRHFKAKIVISSQYYLDLLPESRLQMDYFLLFRAQSLKKLKEIYKDASLSVPFSTYLQMYEDATEEKYSFLYIDCNEELFRQRFDKELII